MVEQTQVQRVESVLKQIRELKEKDEKAAQATGKNFNVFSVIGVERKEVRHSAFLKDLLDPKGTHSQSAVFLEHFLKLPPLLEKLPRLFYENLREFQVTKEQYAPYSDDEYGKIDIFLEKRDACVIIENKIDRPLDSGQLNKYYTYAKRRGFRQIGLVYLTPNGKKPSEESLSGQEPLEADRVICISYESHIVEWLDKCLKEVANIDRIRDLLLQYQMLVKEPTGKLIDKKLTMKMADLIKNSDLIYDLECSIPEAKKLIELELLKFWKKLKEKEIAEVCSIERCSEEPKEIEEYTVIDFKVASCNRNQSFDIGFMIEVYYPSEVLYGLHYPSEVFYGFGLRERNERSNKCDEKKFIPYVDLVTGEPLNMERENGNKWWLGWKSLEYVPDQLEDLVERIAAKSKIVIEQFRESQQEADL